MYSNNMIQMQCSIKRNMYLLHNDPWVLKMVYTNAAELSVALAFTGVDRWRGPPNNRLRDSADIPDFHPRFHLNNDAGKFE
jgi:hypothetical protein